MIPDEEGQQQMRPIDRFRRLRLGVLAAGLVIVGCFTWMGGIAAQEATPGAAGEVVPPEECTASRLPITFLADLIATPIAAPATPITTLPAGTAPDDRTRQEVTAAIRQIIACTNTGDVLRALSLFGDEYLRRTLTAAGQLTRQQAIDSITALATPFAIPSNLLVRLVEIPDIRVLPDGRVAAVVVTVPLSGGLETDLFVFARPNGTWLVDDAVSHFDQVQGTASPVS